MRKCVRRVSPEIIGMHPLVETMTTRLASIKSGATAEPRGEVPCRRIKAKAAICSAPALILLVLNCSHFQSLEIILANWFLSKAPIVDREEGDSSCNSDATLHDEGRIPLNVLVFQTKRLVG